MDKSRRSFIKKSLVVLGSAPLIARSTEAFAEVKPLDPSAPTASALGYYEDNTKVDTKKYPKKAEAGGDKQMCSACALYTEGGQKVAGKSGDWGKCAIFPGTLVSGSGWCMSFAPKPA